MTMRISKDRIDVDDKVLLKPVLKDYGETLVGGASGTNTGSSYTVDLTLGNTFNLILNANCSFTFSNPPASGTAGGFTLMLTQDATGNRTVTWPAAVMWSGGTSPTLSANAEDIDILSFITVDGGTTWLGSLSGQFPGPVITWTFVGSCTGTTSLDFSSLSSGSIAAGDFAVYIDYTMHTSVPAQVVPSGFTNRVSTGFVSSGQDMRGMISDKKLDGTEGSVTGMQDGFNRFKIGLVYRPSSSFSTITASTPTSEATDGNPSSQAINPSAESAPVIVIGVTAVGGAAATFSTASPAWDATVVGSTNWLLSGYKIYGAGAAASHTIDSNDLGTQNWLAGIYYKSP